MWRVRNRWVECDIYRPKFEPRDIWVGVYWNRQRHCADTPNELVGVEGPDVTCMETSVYVCVVPMVVLKVIVFSGFRLGW